MIAKNLSNLNNLISTQCSHLVTLIAVSKMKTIDDITQAINAGQKHFGENYLQEAVEKIEFLNKQHQDLQWHFIGHIQSKKAKTIAQYFDWVQSVDRLKVAQKLNDNRKEDQEKLNVLVQVNISNEPQKSGINIDEVDNFCKEFNNFDRLILRGFMCIDENSQDLQKQAHNFSKMKALFDEMQKKYPSIDTLSMGMSGDFKIALHNGSNMVRIGSAIFGERN